MNGRFRGRSSGKGHGKQCPLCIFYCLLGHIVDKCYKKHRFLIGYKSSNVIDFAHMNSVSTNTFGSSGYAQS